MAPSCPVCDQEMELRIRGDVMPTDLFDDATVLLYRCQLMTHSAALVLVQSERRGSIDDETVKALAIPIAEHTLRRLRELADACPNRNDWKCTCAWHGECSAASVIANGPSLALQPGKPYSDEDEMERNAYHYGVSN